MAMNGYNANPIDLSTHKGWARPTNAKKIHHYAKGVARCGNSPFMSPRGRLDEKVEDRCKVCIRLLAHDTPHDPR